jgi:hypothetical protein
MLLATLIVATAAGSFVHGQRPSPSVRLDASVPVTIALRAGADGYNFSGKATCTYAPVAGIYNLRAEQWRVQQSGDAGSLALTFWHPASGADMFSLSLSAGNKRTSVNTVKVGTNGTVEGSGSVTLARQGNGGTFTVSAAAASGTKVTGTITCAAFTPAVAEGGH